MQQPSVLYELVPMTSRRDTKTQTVGDGTDGYPGTRHRLVFRPGRHWDQMTGRSWDDLGSSSGERGSAANPRGSWSSPRSSKRPGSSSGR